MPYDIVVVALGSIARTLPIPGLGEEAVGFKTVEEAIYLRNQVLESLDIAESTADEARRKRALTFVFVGGGYAGVEAMAELEDMARFATRYYSRVSAADLRFVMVEATDRILPEVGEDMGKWTVEQLRKRGIEMALSTRLESCVDGHVELSDGQKFESDTVVWTAGVKASPVLTDTDLPLDEKGRLRAQATLQVVDVENAWGAGDAVAVPDLTKPGEFTAPNAQHAVRQARRLADNILAVLRGKRAETLRAQVRRVGREPRAAQGRRAGLRHQGQGLAGLVHAPDLPPVAGADLQPQGSRGLGVDAGAVLQARGGPAGLAGQAVRGVRDGGRHVAERASARPTADAGRRGDGRAAHLGWAAPP